MSEIVDFLKLLLVVANLCNLQFFFEQICVHDYDWSINPILPKIDIHVRFTMMHVSNDRLFQDYYWELQIYVTYVNDSKGN